MSIDTQTPPPAAVTDAAPPRSTFPPRLRFAVAAVILYWAVVFLTGWLEIPTVFRFLPRLLAFPALILFFLVWWWWANRRSVRFADRLFGFAVVAGGAVAASWLAHPS